MIYYSKNTKNVLRTQEQTEQIQIKHVRNEKTKKSKPTKLDLAVGEVLWWFQATSRGRRREPHLKCTCLFGWGGGWWRVEGEEGGVFFLVLLFVTPLKMYMGITSKLVNRKHPLAIFWGVRYIVRYKCTRDIWNTTKPPCTLFSLLQKTFFVTCCFILFFLHLSFFSCDKNKCRERLLSP